MTASTNTHLPLRPAALRRHVRRRGRGGRSAQRSTTLTGTGHVGDGRRQRRRPLGRQRSRRARRAARSTQNPCSMEAREPLTVGDQRRSCTRRSARTATQITSIVIVGGDDIIPLAPVAQHTSQFNEASHAGDLRLSQHARPATPARAVADGASTRARRRCRRPPRRLHPHRRPVRSRHGLRVARRLPLRADRRARPARRDARPDPGDDRPVRRRRAACSDADSTLTGGYGAWSELPELVTDQRWRWRSPAPTTTSATPWTTRRRRGPLVPDRRRERPRVVSINTHADETRMLPGMPRRRDRGRSPDADLFTAAGHDERRAARRRAHLPDRLPRRQQPADAPTTATSPTGSTSSRRRAGYVGNTGYGLANNVTTALSERLLGALRGLDRRRRSTARRSRRPAHSPTRSSRTSAASASTRATTRRC